MIIRVFFQKKKLANFIPLSSLSYEQTRKNAQFLLLPSFKLEHNQKLS